ncbi:response regulator transcription factor [Bradyrhizobium jicamae]|uniref:Response regulator transcription factor n=1 Tax=Bradyrhizobium jicamae TaxID=280332 RepID=A0ABS5FQ85_9BRAD|nr:LuxR C-terminal-related transcriptional regulator [Bradyrhizobium jicamae]MBR0798966.1 response regulator transcription factor [Bradyrhizobium jicamae]MBR0936815.1 response regulator transcription factor [Bradyrhizobium jicamae]
MIALLGRPDPATTQAIQFARGILEGSATAFYEVDGNLTLNRFVLSSNVPPNFHDQYLAGMNRLDPLHPRSARNQPIARLSVALDQCASQEAATYRAFAGQCGVADMIEFFFRRNERIVAGMSVLWAPGCRIPDGSMNIAEKIHDYLEFNLTSRLSSASDESRYGLTAREMEVVELLCCGRTNREIGECLNIGLATVKTHLIHIFEKLGVETRSAVVALMSRPH